MYGIEEVRSGYRAGYWVIGDGGRVTGTREVGMGWGTGEVGMV